MAMENSDAGTLRHHERSVEMTRTTEQQVLADDVTVSGGDTASSCCSNESSECHHQLQSLQSVCRELGRDVSPRSLQVCSPMTVEQVSSVSIEKPTTLQQTSSSPSSRLGPRPPQRILPLTKYSEKLRMSQASSSHVHTGQLTLAIPSSVETASSSAVSVASHDASLSSSSTHRHTPIISTALQHDAKDWSLTAGIHQQQQQPSTCILPTCSGIFTSSFTSKLLEESDRSELMSLNPFFSSDSAAAATGVSAASVGSFVSATAAVQSTTELSDLCGLGLLTTSGLSSSYSGDDDDFQAARYEEWRRPDFLELKAATELADIFPAHGNQPPAHPFHDEDTCMFSTSAATSRCRPSESREAAGVSCQASSRSSRSTHMPPTPQAGALVPKSELVEPLLSLHIDNDDDADDNNNSPDGRRAKTTSGHGETVRRRTHPGCSTLRYNRRHNPGLHRPRAYRCDRPGQSTSNAHALQLHSHA